LENYLRRLMNCGYSPSEAKITYNDFMKNFNVNHLEQFLKSLEGDVYVDKIQRQPNC
jgi:hypothetical protein